MISHCGWLSPPRSDVLLAWAAVPSLTLVLLCVQVFMTGLAVWLMDKAGRRLLLMVRHASGWCRGPSVLARSTAKLTALVEACEPPVWQEEPFACSLRPLGIPAARVCLGSSVPLLDWLQVWKHVAGLCIRCSLRTPCR